MTIITLITGFIVGGFIGTIIGYFVGCTTGRTETMDMYNDPDSIL